MFLRNFLAALVLVLSGWSGVNCHAQAFQSIDPLMWTDTSVRKVLHVFAYGGLATDQQISAWSNMPPAAAIDQILTFSPTNEFLSPTQDTTASSGTSLTALQEFWSSANLDNPVRADRRYLYNVVNELPSGELRQSGIHLQHTWIAAASKRGLNPFTHRVGLWLTNYQMAVSLDTITPVLMRDLYDRSLDALASGQSFGEMLGVGATSAAVAFQYGHRSNRFNNAGNFIGNDDFAREFHQLFFMILGEGEDPDYHENTTIEHTAWALTGMQLDQMPNAFDTTRVRDSWTAPIDFSNHFDQRGRNVRNQFWQYDGTLEILHQPISGLTAFDKLTALAQIAIENPESLNNIPVSIVNFFADDNMNEAKAQVIRDAWKSMPEKDLLGFLQDYAISTLFHQGDTYKFRTAFSRNMSIYNLNTVDNEESYLSSLSPRGPMLQQGAVVFHPAHNVFGGQTSLNAANSSSVFQAAYNRSVDNPGYYAKVQEVYTDESGVEQTWLKDWARIVDVDNTDDYNVDKLGEWLWQRFVGDGLNNYGVLERAYVNSFLATGDDLAYTINPDNLDIAYSVADLESDQISEILDILKDSRVALDSPIAATRKEANRRIGHAVRFIVATPFMYLIEGAPSDLTDTDADGVADIYDNCLLVANGAADTQTAGLAQLDADNDGYGNICDGDFNNDNTTDFLDIVIFRNNFSTTNPVVDLDGSGSVTFIDFFALTQMFLMPPGPSGYIQ